MCCDTEPQVLIQQEGSLVIIILFLLEEAQFLHALGVEWCESDGGLWIYFIG